MCVPVLDLDLVRNAPRFDKFVRNEFEPPKADPEGVSPRDEVRPGTGREGALGYGTSNPVRRAIYINNLYKHTTTLNYLRGASIGQLTARNETTAHVSTTYSDWLQVIAGRNITCI